jgi:uncharacterized protein
MQQRLGMITIGVDDLERSLKFYRDGLGFKTDGIVGTEFDNGAVVFFDLQPDLKLALFSRSNLAHDAGIAQTPRSPSEFSLGHMVRDPEEVEAVMRTAVTAGAKILRPAGNTFWGGYAGYFQDPDGHLWEIVYNPSCLPPA